MKTGCLNILFGSLMVTGIAAGVAGAVSQSSAVGDQAQAAADRLSILWNSAGHPADAAAIAAHDDTHARFIEADKRFAGTQPLTIFSMVATATGFLGLGITKMKNGGGRRHDPSLEV